MLITRLFNELTSAWHTWTIMMLEYHVNVCTVKVNDMLKS